MITVCEGNVRSLSVAVIPCSLKNLQHVSTVCYTGEHYVFNLNNNNFMSTINLSIETVLLLSSRLTWYD